MAPQVQDLEVFLQLMEILDDHEGIENLLTYPPQTVFNQLTESQKCRWSRLVQHFCSTDTVDESDEVEKSTNKRPRNTPRNPWAKFSKVKSLELPRPYKEYIEKHGTNAVDFLNDRAVLVHRIADPDSDEADAIIACLRYTWTLRSREAKDRIRWFFSMLFYFDLARLKYHRASGRVGTKMQKEIEKLVKERVRDPVDLSQLGNWSIQGSKLHELCEAFGVGCLFYLEDLLTENFLKKQFTHSGSNHDEAFINLRNRGLSHEAAGSGANELGQNIRDYLIRPFTLASQGHLSPPVEPDTSASEG
ncbi:MAG: hypothetical protein Q9218_002254 [Villophora microphyllina]